MFFESENISFELLSVLKLSWDENNGRSGIRPFHALSYRIRGDTGFSSNGDRLSAKSGDIVFVPASLEYTMEASAEELFCVHFYSESPLPTRIKKITPEAHNYFERKFKELYDVWSAKQFGFEYECRALFLRIILNIEKQEMKYKNYIENDAIFEAIDYIHENYMHKAISVEELSKMCGMSDTYFRRLFVRKFEITPLRYINNLKVSHAVELLHSGYYTIQEISDMCGFDSISYFSRFIKKETEKTPAQIAKGN